VRFSVWRQAFWDPWKNPLIFFAVAFAVGISINVLSSWLEDWDWAVWIFGIGVPLVLVAVILSPLYDKLWRYPEAVPVIVPSRSCKGLVVIVSQGVGSSSARAAIDYHVDSLQRVWIIHSEASEPDAKTLQSFCVTLPGLIRDQVIPLALTDQEFVANPEATRVLIEERVYGDLGDLQPDDVIIDVTGGTKATSVGATLAGLPLGRRLELVRGLKFDERGRATVAGEPFEIRMDYKLKPHRRQKTASNPT